MIYTFIVRACTDLPVSACCRAVKVSTSGFYAWQANPVTEKDLDDAYLTNTIVDIHTMSRRSYGSPRIHAELRLGEGVRCSKKRVERLMRQAGVSGIYRRRRQGCTRRDLAAVPSDDLVNRQFDPARADQLWLTDITEHPTAWNPAVVATVLSYEASSKAASRSAGVSQSSDFRGRPLSSSSMHSRWPSGDAARYRGDHRPFRPRVDLHVVGLRPAPARSWPARIDGIGGRLLR